MSFYSDKFIFGSTSSEDMNVILVNLNNDVLMEYGIKYKDTVGYEYSKNNKFYYSQNSDIDTITLSLALVDEHGLPECWSIDERQRVIDWMCTRDFKPFISGDNQSVVYYLRCVEYIKKFTSEGHGVIEFIMQPESQYAYTPIIEHIYRVDGEENIIIDHVGNVEDKYFPKIEVLQFSNTNEPIEISNETTGEYSFIINKLNFNEKLEVDHKLKLVTSSDGELRLGDVNRKWLWLKRGLNVIRVCGNCDIKITTQYALRV